MTKYYARILSYCQVHVGDFGYAEDITQETFERFLRLLKQYRHYGKAVKYLYVIAANACRDHHRKHKEIAAEKITEMADGCAEDPAVLYFQQEQKQKAIAVMLGIGLPLVKYRIRRARELLAAYLKDS